MAKQHQLSFTGLELKGLWIKATGGDTSADPLLDKAADNAIDKVYREEHGMPRKAHPEPPGGRKAGKLPRNVIAVVEAYRDSLTQSLFAVAPEPPEAVERVAVLPQTCPHCDRANGTIRHWGDSKGYGWHYYRRVPGAPALVCGGCGRMVYVTEDVLEEVRAEAQHGLPKVVAGKTTKRRR